MTNILVRRRTYGSLLFEDCEPAALEFFARDISSTNGELSYDDRAMSGQPDHFDQTDVVVIRGGMGLNRHPKSGWNWLVEAAPTALVAALPGDTPLGDIADDEYPAARSVIEQALHGFIGETGTRRGLAVATKMLHLKRPGLIPICDSYTVAMLGVALTPDADKKQRVEAGLIACDLIRRAARENRDQLRAIGEHLSGKGFQRTPVRVLDAMLWLAYGGTIRAGRARPVG